jgi:hypothetical protein
VLPALLCADSNYNQGMFVLREHTAGLAALALAATLQTLHQSESKQG